MSERKLTLTIIGDASALERALGQANKKTQTFGDKLMSTGSLLTKGITLPAIAAGVGLFKLGEKFDEATDTIRLGTGATGKDLEKLKGTFKAVYTSVPVDAATAATAIADLNTRTGQTGKGLENLTKTTLNLSRVAGEELKPLIAATTRVFGDWGVETGKQTGTLDYLWKVSQSTGVGVSDLSNKMVQFGAPLRQMGFDFETSAALMGKFEKEGVNLELVMGSLRIALGKMAKEGIKDPAEALKVMVARIKEAGSAGEANKLALEMFGAKAGPDMAAAIREGRFDLDGLLRSLKESPETIGKAAAETDDFRETMQLLANRIETKIEPLAKKLFDAFEKMEPQLSKAVDTAGNLIDKFASLDPKWQKIILAAIGFAIALGPVLMLVGQLSNIIKIATAVQWLWNAALNANPIGLVVLAIAALIAAGVLLYQNWDKIKKFILETWDAVKKKTTEVWDGLKTWLAQTWKSITATAGNALEGIVDAVTEPFRRAWESVKVWIDKIKDAMSNLNPFKRQSPSLVDNVVAGVDIIKAKYGELGDISISRTAVYPAGFSAAAAGGASRVSIYISGNYISERYDVERIGDDLVNYLRRKGVKL